VLPPYGRKSSTESIVNLFYLFTEINNNSEGVKSPFLNFGSLSQKELPPHRNAGMEIVFVSEGRLRWQVEGQREELPAGSVFFTLPWQAHGSEYVHEPGNRIHFLQLRLDRRYAAPVRSFGFDPALNIPPAAARRLSRILAGTTQHTWPASPALEWLIRKLIERLEGEGSTLFLQGLVMSLLAELVDTIEGNRVLQPSMNPTERRVHALAVRVEADCAEAWTLPRMMMETRLGATHLTEIFKQQTGDSPVAYLKRSRVARSERLLATTERSVTDIALECGFSTTQLFCRVFKQFTHRTPTQFRREIAAGHHATIQDWSEADEQRRLKAIQGREWI